MLGTVLSSGETGVNEINTAPALLELAVQGGGADTNAGMLPPFSTEGTYYVKMVEAAGKIKELGVFWKLQGDPCGWVLERVNVGAWPQEETGEVGRDQIGRTSGGH